MRIGEIGKTIIDGELTLRKLMAIRLGRQAAFLVVAAVFGGFATITGHGLLWAFCYQTLGLSVLGASCAVFAVDIIAACMFAFMGRRSYMTAEEIRVRFAREHALNELRQTVALSAVVGTVAGPVTRHTGRAIWNLFQTVTGRRPRS
ncbi:hypothetical protein IFJ82_01430 [Novacetimonas hansenii]|uniref:Phage holin family protein n=2 Tax=Novacetimonas hansenii TaxID=436 RepID=A0AAW5ETC7_NOVHA|nr:hypothetical protein [Novacetimonas hansenii]EFG85970.1 hypothetical protein GXY_00264 [Novacetimonas hansenii ATCC 23769]MBL7237473.1 hypothetical protein [Novacetimonas hansenii]MCJ8354789.1 hypothetical protein [Novacetimonas hansenii]PYD72162.1 hypothetical protein CFR74_11160 [Novacetimonas hansenii]QOF95405.1 hypothetical protein IFJ82_01430 [Novacetimonas hansenii]